MNGDGGGIYMQISNPNNPDLDVPINEPMMEMTDCIIRNNSAASDWEPNGGIGGGVYIRTERKIKIDKCEITNNFAEERGGGLYLAGDVYSPIDSPQVAIDIINSTIAYNRAYGNNSYNTPPGRGIQIGGHSYVNLVNSIVYGNWWQEVQGSWEGEEIGIFGSDWHDITLNIQYSDLDGGTSEIHLGYPTESLIWGWKPDI